MATYALVPPAGSGPWYWHLLKEELTARGHEVIAVDLPVDDDSAGLAEYTEAAVQAIGQARDLVVVGQSLGAYTAPLVCDRLPADLLILLTPMLPKPGESAGEWWEATGHAEARKAQAEREGWTAEQDQDPSVIFFHELSPALVEEAAKNSRDQSGRPFGDPWPLSKWPDVPTRALICTGDRFFPVDFSRRLVRERLGIEADEMGGSHPVALSRPKELADKLEEIRLDVLGADAR
ncbi:alpha/beta hydrolase [Micromonospora sp. WMMD882]|uniref:alpha/beta hydrolase n=1 Tax=Micromonospora sp. WMMD882 TaxID=3015151 RepID=UPI00248B1D15|nr:alpha/beta hydrolase [Micromonospora sp. WMMD882]WBB78700.1 alpha/beta hydrolase [Micromonospora sp. WMMD882]